MNRRPDLFIIGAGTSGTTALYEYLGEHPQIYMSAVKEPSFFCPDVEDSGGLAYPDDIERYLALFSPSERDVRVGEASTAYLRSRLAPELIRDFQPEPWIIAMVREPVERLSSMHGQRVALGMERQADFAAAIEGIGTDFPYVERARVARDVGRWQGAFPADRMRVILFDDFVADTVTVLRETLAFLRVDDSFRPRSLAPRNAAYSPRALTAALARSRPARFVAHGVLPRLVGENRARRLTRSARHSRLWRAPRRRPPVPPVVRARLEEQLAPDVAELSRLLGRDLLAEWFGRR